MMPEIGQHCVLTALSCAWLPAMKIRNWQRKSKVAIAEARSALTADVSDHSRTGDRTLPSNFLRLRRGSLLRRIEQALTNVLKRAPRGDFSELEVKMITVRDESAQLSSWAP